MSEAKKPETDDIPTLKKGLQDSLDMLQEQSAGVIDAAEKLARRARDSGLMRAVTPPAKKPDITAKFAALRAPARVPT